MSMLLAIQFSKLEGLLPLERHLEFVLLANMNMSPSETDDRLLITCLRKFSEHYSTTLILEGRRDYLLFFLLLGG